LAAGFAAGVVFGTTLRAIGRGLGNGTLARASTAIADNTTVSAKVAAGAVDRRAAARMNGVTEFLRGESFNRSSPRSI
jgi:hypothetical protein